MFWEFWDWSVCVFFFRSYDILVCWYIVNCFVLVICMNEEYKLLFFKKIFNSDELIYFRLRLLEEV